MIFYEILSKKAARISLFKKKFEKAWLSAHIFKFPLRFAEMHHPETANFGLRLQHNADYVVMGKTATVLDPWRDSRLNIIKL